MENRKISDRTDARNASLSGAASADRGPDLDEVPLDGRPASSLAETLFRSPVLTGAAAAGVFYLGLLKVVLPLVPSYRASLETLFCGHPLAYGTTILFWMGMAALGGKWLSVSADRDALKWMPELDSTGGAAVSG